MDIKKQQIIDNIKQKYEDKYGNDAVKKDLITNQLLILSQKEKLTKGVIILNYALNEYLIQDLDDLDRKLSYGLSKLSYNLSLSPLKHNVSPGLPRLSTKMLSDEVNQKTRQIFYLPNRSKLPSVSPSRLDLSLKNHGYREKSSFSKSILKNNESSFLSSPSNFRKEMPQSYGGESLIKLENHNLNHPIPSFNKSDMLEKVKESTPISKLDTTRNTKISSSELRSKVIIYLINHNRK